MVKNYHKNKRTGALHERYDNAIARGGGGGGMTRGTLEHITPVSIYQILMDMLWS